MIPIVPGNVTEIMSVVVKSIPVVQINVPEVRALTVRMVDRNWQPLKVFGVMLVKVVGKLS